VWVKTSPGRERERKKESRERGKEFRNDGKERSR